MLIFLLKLELILEAVNRPQLVHDSLLLSKSCFGNLDLLILGNRRLVVLGAGSNERGIRRGVLVERRPKEARHAFLGSFYHHVRLWLLCDPMFAPTFVVLQLLSSFLEVHLALLTGCILFLAEPLAVSCGSSVINGAHPSLFV